MNILWIAPYPTNKDQHPAPWILMLAKEVVQAGHHLTILTPSARINELKKMDSGHGYDVIVLPYKGGLMHLVSLFRNKISAIEKYLNSRSGSFDLIHVHGTELQLASPVIRLKGATPHIISIQGIMSLYVKELVNKFTRGYLYWNINSFYEKQEIRHSRHFFCRTDWDQKFVRSVNAGADISVCWELLRPEFFEYRHEFSGTDILFLGGDNPLKALGHCLTVFNRLAMKKNIRLHIIGGTQKGVVANLLKSLELDRINETNLVLHGNLEATQICEVYKKCFCLYHPSLIDNSPNSVCEAQTAGLPVIATRVGGVPSLIVDGQTGLLVEKNDVEGHLASLNRLAADAGLQRQLSEQARKIALKRHDRKNIVDTTLHTYHRLTGQNHA